MTNEKRAQQLAYKLQKSNYDLAFVEDRGRVFYSYYPKNSKDLSSSAVIQLLQGLFNQFVDNSFFILRRRIFATHVLSSKDEGMIRVVAKRAQGQTQAMDHGLSLEDLDFISITFTREQAQQQNHLTSINLALPAELQKQKIESSEDRWGFVNQLANLNPRGSVLHDHDRPVAAALWSTEGELLSYGINSNSLNKTLHAEVNLVQSFCLKYEKPLPKGSTLFVTHKPCRMCAGMIFDCSEAANSMQIFYLHEETGSFSRNTVLDSHQLNRMWPTNDLPK